MSEQVQLTVLLQRLTAGDPGAAAEVIPLIYQELRQLAEYYMARERSNHILRTTALVHEAYLRLVDQRQTNWRNRAHFYGAAAQTMRRILVDHARAGQAEKRGGGAMRLSLDEAARFPETQTPEIVQLDDALTRLAAMDSRQSRIVELRFFAGLTVEETAEVMGISPKTVKRDWSVARAWLHRELRGTPQTLKPVGVRDDA
jgi:RNA polymerase sigma factor (TIGR02999 family)